MKKIVNSLLQELTFGFVYFFQKPAIFTASNMVYKALYDRFSVPVSWKLIFWRWCEHWLSDQIIFWAGGNSGKKKTILQYHINPNGINSTALQALKKVLQQIPWDNLHIIEIMHLRVLHLTIVSFYLLFLLLLTFLLTCLPLLCLFTYLFYLLL